MKRAEREENIKIVIEELSQKLKDLGMHFEVAGRPKHLYSIYRKMVIQNKPFDQIYDLIAIRVLVDTVPDCYTVLGVCHTLWTQVPGRFKDYISVPKNNMYQSLHTTVIGGRRIPFPFEIQIRTWEMHHVAEYGIAAHWRYKEGGDDKAFDRKLYWLRQILDWQGETRDSHEFIDGLKTDIFAEQVFIFTPKGDIIDMPRGATSLDFAYRVHSAVGNSCIGAKVNGRIVPLDTPLETGDRVEIMTSSAAKGPSMDWLKIVKTQGARSKIRQYFKRELRGENVTKGKDLLDREAKRRGLQLGVLMKDENVTGLEPLLKKYAFSDAEDIYGAVGYGMIAAAYVITRLYEEQQKAEEAAAPKALPALPEVGESAAARTGKPTQGIYVEGGSGMLVRFARCCNPVPGDDIVGYITRGRGVTVHKADCVNAQHSEPERAIRVSWAEESIGRFTTTIQVIAYDHPSLLGELTVFVQDGGAPISAMSVKISKNKTCTIQMEVQVESREKLDAVLARIRKRPDVIEAFRGGKNVRSVIQRVTRASVAVGGEVVGSIGEGLLVLLGVKVGDTEKDADYMADKLLKLRIFEDENGKMNRSVRDIGGSVLCVSQFTLLGDARGQNRPGFTQAEAPERANALYQRVCQRMRDQGMTVAQGIFRAEMQVELVNNGPVTILLDSEKNF